MFITVVINISCIGELVGIRLWVSDMEVFN